MKFKQMREIVMLRDWLNKRGYTLDKVENGHIYITDVLGSILKDIDKGILEWVKGDKNGTHR
jgi:hypothetical protein